MQIVCTMKRKAIKKTATTKIIQDTRRALKDSTFPIKIRITFQRKQVYYSTPYSLSIDDFSKISGISVLEKRFLKNKNIVRKTKEELKRIAFELQEYEIKAAKIIESLPIFTFDLFEKKFLTNRIENDFISKAFQQTIDAFKKNDQIGTAVSYECAKKSLETFAEKTRVNAKTKFTDVTPDFLRKYEGWMLENGRSTTTISMYLRHLRTLFNKAIADELIPREIYPFGAKKYNIPAGNNIKKAMSLDEIALIYNYKAKENSTTEKARDFFLFMYFCNGMNMKDVCLLKYRNIQGDMIVFQRAKTARTRKNATEIRVPITPDVDRIITKYGNKNKDPNNFIFPILSKELTAERERQLIQQETHVINDHLKIIAKDLKLQHNITSYTARHSFATVMQRSGISTSFISEALGHSNETTTRNYLAGFMDEQKKETAKLLTAFKDKA